MYKSLSLGVLATLTSFFSGSVAFAADLDQDNAVLTIYGEATINGVTAKVTRGVNPDNTVGILGAFSEFHENNTVTIDFNTAGTHTAGNTYTFGNELITYTFEKGIATNPGQGTGVYNDVWAPTGANGEKNTSDYLAVFNDNSVTIDLAKELNYFGINWGAISPNNNFTFLKDGLQVSNFTYNDINPIAPVKASHQNNEGNGYIHFYAEEADSTFNQIIISQTGGGGFETDNHSFRFGDEAFNFDDPSQDVPEPKTILGLLTIGVFMSGFRVRKLFCSSI